MPLIGSSRGRVSLSRSILEHSGGCAIVVPCSNNMDGNIGRTVPMKSLCVDIFTFTIIFKAQIKKEAADIWGYCLATNLSVVDQCRIFTALEVFSWSFLLCAPCDSSFPVIHKVTFLYCIHSVNELDKVTNYINFKSIHCDKYESAKILIWLVAVFNLFTLEIVQKYQLCVLRENSNVYAWQTIVRL